MASCLNRSIILLALSVATLCADPVNRDGLIGWWLADPGSVNAAGCQDRSGNTGNRAVVIGDGVSVNTNGMSFVGTTDYLQTTNDVPELNAAQRFTVCGWARQITLDEKRGLIQKNKSAAEEIALFTWSTGALFIYLTGYGATPYASYDYSTTVTAGKWFHWALTYNGSEATNTNRVKWYVDAARVTLTHSGTWPTNGPALGSAYKFRIGKGSDDSGMQTWKGDIADVQVYSRELLTPEINAQYTRGQAKGIYK